MLSISFCTFLKTIAVKSYCHTSEYKANVLTKEAGSVPPFISSSNRQCKYCNRKAGWQILKGKYSHLAALFTG